MIIRNEEEKDYRIVEEMIKKHFGIYLFQDAMSIILHIRSGKVRIIFLSLILLLKRMDKLLDIFYM